MQFVPKNEGNDSERVNFSRCGTADNVLHSIPSILWPKNVGECLDERLINCTHAEPQTSVTQILRSLALNTWCSVQGVSTLRLALLQSRKMIICPNSEDEVCSQDVDRQSCKRVDLNHCISLERNPHDFQGVCRRKRGCGSRPKGQVSPFQNSQTYSTQTPSR